MLSNILFASLWAAATATAPSKWSNSSIRAIPKFVSHFIKMHAIRHSCTVLTRYCYRLLQFWREETLLREPNKTVNASARPRIFLSQCLYIDWFERKKNDAEKFVCDSSCSMSRSLDCMHTGNNFLEIFFSHFSVQYLNNFIPDERKSNCHFKW